MNVRQNFYFISRFRFAGLVLLAMASAVNPVAADTEVWSFRGGSGIAPENTIEGMNLAFDLGASGTEIDLWHAGIALGPTVTPEIVIHHDRNVARTTNGSGEIQNLTPEYLSTLDAGSSNGKTRFPGARIPTLDEALNVLQARDKAVLLDIKTSPFGQPGTVPVTEVAAAIQRANLQRDNIYTWTSVPSRIQQYTAAIPDLQVIFNGNVDPNTVVWQDLIDQGYSGILIRYDDQVGGGGEFNQAFIDEIHANGLFVVLNGGTVARFRQAVEFGVDIVMTHNTDGFTQVLAEMRTPLLGDCNFDGAISFLDISPFVAVLTAGDYLAEADTNQDDAVDFLDIRPMVSILTDNSTTDDSTTDDSTTDDSTTDDSTTDDSTTDDSTTDDSTTDDSTTDDSTTDDSTTDDSTTDDSTTDDSTTDDSTTDDSTTDDSTTDDSTTDDSTTDDSTTDDSTTDDSTTDDSTTDDSTTDDSTTDDSTTDDSTTDDSTTDDSTTDDSTTDDSTTDDSTTDDSTTDGLSADGSIRKTGN